LTGDQKNKAEPIPQSAVATLVVDTVEIGFQRVFRLLTAHVCVLLRFAETTAVVFESDALIQVLVFVLVLLTLVVVIVVILIVVLVVIVVILLSVAVIRGLEILPVAIDLLLTQRLDVRRQSTYKYTWHNQSEKNDQSG
jgi:hypothetical protein